jgi:hypothetical protein
MFIFKIKQEEKEVTVGFKLQDVYHFTYDSEVLHIVFKEQRTTLQQVNVPVTKGKEIKMEMQSRNVTDFFTIAVEDKEITEKFLKLMEALAEQEEQKILKGVK